MSILMNRRRFLSTSAFAGGTGVLLLANPRSAFSYEANDRLTIAAIGVGGQGRSNLDQFAGLGQDIVALCDVDRTRAGDVYEKHPAAKVYTDYRRMLDRLGNEIDAVVVSTPDHTHAVAAVAAMRLNKHVYCEKPLTRTVQEARVLRQVALEQKVVTQMGNQGSAASGLRRAVELAQGGLLGEIDEAHVWFDGGNSPMTRPTDRPAVPETLDWDLWLGPASLRPYHPAYLPATWRGWRPFGSGIVGDFGCHTGNIAFRALRLDQLFNASTDKTVVRVESWPSEADLEGYPRAMRAQVDLPARGEMPPVKLMIYAARRPEEALMLGYPQSGWGDLLVGRKASLYSDCPWNTRFVLLPEDRFVGFQGGPPESLPRSPGHHREWVDACKGRGRTFSPFEVGGPLTELLQLVNLATLVEGPLDFATSSSRILNNNRADQLLHREYRPGWSI